VQTLASSQDVTKPWHESQDCQLGLGRDRVAERKLAAVEMLL